MRSFRLVHASLFGLFVLGSALAACGSSDDTSGNPDGNDAGNGTTDSGGNPNDGGAADATPSSDATTGIEVTGTLLTVRGTPIAAIPIIVAGRAPVVTDASGHFTVENVTTPYDAVAVFGESKTVIAYEGLTRPDPKILAFNNAVPLKSSSVTGTLSGGNGYPDVTTLTAIQLGSPFATSRQSTTSVGTSSFTYNADWYALPNLTGSLYALQYAHAAGKGQPTSYTGFGKLDNVTVGATATAVGQITLGAGPTSAVFGATITKPAGFTVSVITPSVLVDGNWIGLPNADSNDSPLSYVLPNVTGAKARVQVNADDGNGGISIGFKSMLDVNSTTTTIGLLTPSVPALPVDSATGITTSTSFSWTAFPGGIHVTQMTPSGGSLPSYFVVTADTKATIPETSSSGLTLPKAANYTWSVFGLAPYASVDAFAGEAALPRPDVTEIYQCLSKTFSFTTSP